MELGLHRLSAAAPQAAQTFGTDAVPLVEHRAHTVLGELSVHDSQTPGPTGAAQVLVLWPSILADHRIYLPQVARWRQRYRVLLIDGPGHGRSGPAPGPFSMAQCAQAQAQVLDQLGVRQPVVSIGTSWGGLVGGEFALMYPARTRALVMLNTPVFPSRGGLGDRFVTWGARWMHGLRMYTDGVARAFFLPSTRAQQNPFMAVFREHLAKADGHALARSVQSVLVERADLSSRLGQIAAPTLFVAGENDDMYPLEDLRRAAATLPRGRFVALPTAHISVVDAPEQTMKAIDDFLVGL
ncbi:MAG TPA: alpha/beta hydrolase [Hydrogenophaga sp.]|uniref:alpha/beta fold hydrolase n=1 Tax=Hydrogenophaga sp. TaxID=1904254 RepID=UPI002C1C20C1|nr:alpha/beta hydrolase [Hydrogenophaga sp.]HMN94030.1 alpha/beta hydrolase [Hydrogenophaga sp.]HMP12158.1 alpha/beta hydrolase [Hydrogenophaga sp.]